jgi:hypothetical protein
MGPKTAVALATAGLMALGSGSLAIAPAQASTSGVESPTRGAYFGAAVPDAPGVTGQQVVLDYERAIGRKLDLERVYKRWDDSMVNDTMRWDRDNHRSIVLSVNSVMSDGSHVRWADIAAGRYDSVIAADADAVKAFAAPIWLAFNHEPEDDYQSGGASEFVAAWRHYVNVFRARGATNVSWTWIMMAYSFRPGSGVRAPSYYPGDDYVDFVAADGYNWYECAGRTAQWAPFQNVFDDFHAFGVAHGKPEIVAEYGSSEDPAAPGRKAQWLTDAAATVAGWPEIKAVSYWGPGTCFDIKSSTSSLQAFAQMGRNPYFNVAHGTPPAGPARHTVADFDGNGTTDLGIYRPSTGGWYIRGAAALMWGEPTDLPVPGDYTGDGRTDLAIFRPATGTWWIRGVATTAYGQAGDIPVPADYNGDGRTDLAVFRPATGTWWIRGVATTAYGQAGDVPVPADYNGDGRTDLAVFRTATGTWWIRGVATTAYGQAGDIPVPGDYNGDGRTDLAVYRPATGTWRTSGAADAGWGLPTDEPLPLPQATRGHFAW